MSNDADRGSYIRLVDKRLGMVITRWKDSKILQTVSTIMKPGIKTITRRVGSDLIDVRCPSDIVEYQHNMDGVDRGDQHRVMGAGFANVAHFKKWYKKVFMGIADFSFLQAFAAWNLSVQEMTDKSRGGETKRKGLVKWKFYAVAAEEFMSYVDKDESSAVFSQHQSLLRDHQPRPITKDFRNKYPHCAMCSMEESITNRVSGTAKKKGRRKWARQRGYLASCSDPNCKIIAHTCSPVGTKLGLMGNFLGMNCFEIAHTPDAASLFTSINRKGKTYLRCVPSHPICE